MKKRQRSSVLLSAILVATLVLPASALAQQAPGRSSDAPGRSSDAPGRSGDATGPASALEVERSQDLKLMSNSPRTSPVSQSDLAFWGDLAFAGYYDGFRILDISAPGNIRQIADVQCRNNQGDISVWGDLLFISIDRPVTSPDCSGVDTPPGVTGFEGIRIFDVSDPANTGPDDLIAAIPTDCGSHTHTVVPDLDNNRVLLYVSSYPASFLGPTPYGTNCQRLLPDGTQGHSKISIVEVPLDDPASASVIAEPQLELSNHRGTPGYRGCHDITVFMELQVAAAACLSEGQLWDISDPVNPVITDRVFNDAVDIWHSAAFTWDGEIVVFGDEFAGGGGPGCDDPNNDIGRVWFYEREDIQAGPLGSYKIPRPQDGQICTMHNFNVIPTTKGYFLVSASNMGGTTVVDFTDPANPKEIAFFDAQPEAGALVSSPWSSYWYNGFIYVNDRGRGVDVLLLSDSARAGARKLPYLNPQTQESLLP